MTFNQSDINFSSVSYKVVEDGVEIVDKTLFKKSETFQRFEDIGAKVIKSSSVKVKWLIASLIPAALGLWVLGRRLSGLKVGDGAELFYLFCFLVFLSIFFLTRKRSIMLVTEDYDNGLEFFDRKNDRVRIDQFIRQLLEKRNKYLIEKYTDINEALPYEQQYESLVWLHNIKVISKELLKSKVKELDEMNLHQSRGLSQRAKIKGFGNTND